VGTIRIGVIGCGGIFRGAHVPYLQWQADHAPVVAVADARRENARQEAKRFGAALCDDWKALLTVGGTYPEKSKAVANNATVVVKFKSSATGLLIKSWAAEDGGGGEGVACKNGPAKLGGGLTWKTCDMAAPATFADAVPDDNSWSQVPEEQRDRGYWGFASKGASIAHWLDCIEGCSNGRGTGLRVLDEVGRRIATAWGGEVRWLRSTDLASEVAAAATGR